MSFYNVPIPRISALHPVPITTHAVAVPARQLPSQRVSQESVAGTLLKYSDFRSGSIIPPITNRGIRQSIRHQSEYSSNLHITTISISTYFNVDYVISFPMSILYIYLIIILKTFFSGK